MRALLHEGQAALAKGESKRALNACRKVLIEEPHNISAHYLAGSIEAQAGSYQVAAEHLEECTALGAQFPEAYIHLGHVYRLMEDYARAAQSYREAVELDPSNAVGHYNLAVLLRRDGATEEALQHLVYAQRTSTLSGEVVRMRVKTLIELGRYEEAAAVAQAATLADESSYDHWVAWGYSQQKLHRADQALDCYRRALSLRPGDAELFNNYGIVLQDLGRAQDAIRSYDKALELNPAHVLARFHRALAHLLMGNYEAGWPDYELRLLSKDHPARSARHPRWDGTRSDMREILAYGEQGLGDQIMFSSCLPDLVRSARRCVVECSPKLHGLFARSFPAVAVQDFNAAEEGSAAGVDVEVPLGSLPLYYRRSLGAFPRHSGYLVPDASRVAAWRSKLKALGSGLKVGLSWKGGTHKTRTTVRSIPLDQLLPILSVPTVHFVSVQYTADAQSEIAALASSHAIIVNHWQEAIDDYEETAALVSALDLVVSVCTSVVHLAGALARPVWIAAPYAPEWRYGIDGATMPWYPSARLFRQAEYGAWNAVIDDIAKQLQNLASLDKALC